MAALAIPGLIVDSQKKKTVVKLQKIYNVMSNVISLSVSQSGDIKNWDFPKTPQNPNEMNEFVTKYIEPYMSFQKKCIGQTGCFPTTLFMLKGGTFSGYNYNGKAGVAYILNDGMMISFTKPISSGIIYIFADIDGFEGENKAGKDIFHMRISDNGAFNLVGQGSDRENYFTSPWGCNKNSDGESCGGLIQADGWEIKDDYPW